MTKIILHAGMHKTGSTSIQHSLGLRSSDHYFYARWIRLNHSRLFYSNKEDGLERRQALAEIDRVLSASCKQAGKRPIIFSAEDLTRCATDRLQEIRELFYSYSRTVSVYAYVRKPFSFMNSAFQQRLKAGRSRIHAPTLWPNYKLRFGKIDQVFGIDNVHLRPFEKSAFRDGCVVSDFGEWMGIDIPSDGIVTKNESLTLPEAAVLFHVNKLNSSTRSPDKNSFSGSASWKQVSEILAEVRDPARKLLLHRSILEPVYRLMREDVCWMNERLGCEVDDEDIGKYNTSEAISSPRELELIACAAFAKHPSLSSQLLNGR